MTKREDLKAKSARRRQWQADRVENLNHDAMRHISANDLVWYVVQSAPQKEYLAQRMLATQNVPAFVPTRFLWRRKNRFTQKELRNLPLVPRYLFAGFPPDQADWFGLFKRRMIQGVVGIDGEPVKISSVELRAFIREAVGEMRVPDAQRYMRTRGEFDVGDTVRILEGPFQHHLVEVKTLTGKSAEILMNLLGTTRIVKVPVDELERAA